MLPRKLRVAFYYISEVVFALFTTFAVYIQYEFENSSLPE